MMFYIYRHDTKQYWQGSEWREEPAEEKLYPSRIESVAMLFSSYSAAYAMLQLVPPVYSEFRPTGACILEYTPPVTSTQG
jgi:hypothetical protein